MLFSDQSRNPTLNPTVAFPPDCVETVRALWDYLDSALDKPTLAAIDAHLERCAYCRAHLAFETSLVAELRTLRREYTDAQELRERVVTALHDAGMPRR
jgi:anti-sigma factor (TIGR02949 family)